MPAFRNVKSRRSSGRFWNKVPIVYDEQGWEILPSAVDYPRHEVSSPHSSATSPSTTSADSDFENHPLRKSKGKSKASHPSDAEHVPRPKNAFIFYRSYYYQTQGGSDQNQISVAAGKAWKALSDEEKLPYQLMAEKEKRDHQARFPHYTYAPGSKNGSNKRKAAAKKKAPSSAKRALPSKPKAAPRRPSRPHIAPPSREPSPLAEIVLPTLPQLPPASVDEIECSEPMLDLTNEVASADSEGLFTPGWSFVPTSEIPPLELPPAKSEKEQRSEVSTLRPPGYEYIDEQFMPNPVTVPATVESFFAGAPLPEGLHYNYVDFDFGLLPSSIPEASSPVLDWSIDVVGTSQEVFEPSYADYALFAETPDSGVYAAYDPTGTFMHEVKYRMSPPVSPRTIPSHDVLEMEQYINY
ncbi:hypothetical protein LshimejAT787_1100820 [Lyophyllum shimeji]|uniref:HMG box domain-containing protein n=1 Tax=Lyophyllum shimeji TaxID=47721 RepID=A0A9P3PSP6_LYOSH|nr:hypothetical protein LshimejAT787_1100820 [Lyophyllum shimeji]